MPGPVVITGGGTGGHVFAMQAVAEALVALGAREGDLRYVGSARGQEASLLEGGAIAVTLLSGRGLRRSLAPGALAANLAALGGLGVACARATWLVARWRPAAVVSVGGYASLPTALAAVLCRRPLVLVDLDAVPSAVHRVLGARAAARCVAFDDGSGAVVTGAPVRAAIARVARDDAARRAARRALAPPLDDERAVVVVMTGSLGAARVNDAVVELASRWAERADRAIIHVTGRRDAARVRDARPATPRLDYRIEAFADMAALWAVADAAVCRAGATTLAELTTLGVAAVLVPLPGAPRDHQTRNARVLERAGAAVVLADARCTGAALDDALEGLLADGRAREVGAAAQRLAHRDAAAAIARVVARVGGLA